jgi:hypothetical protein
VSKPGSFSRLALPIFRWTAMIIGALIGGVLGVFGFAHVISMDSWVYRYPVSCTVAGVIVAFMLSVAMFGTRRDNPRTWGNFEILAGCGLVWNAIAVAIHQGPQAQTAGTRSPTGLGSSPALIRSNNSTAKLFWNLDR